MKYWIHIDASFSEILKSKDDLTSSNYEGPFETFEEAKVELLKVADEIIFSFKIVVQETNKLNGKKVREI